jgi:hypothetical protein
VPVSAAAPDVYIFRLVPDDGRPSETPADVREKRELAAPSPLLGVGGDE